MKHLILAVLAIAGASTSSHAQNTLRIEVEMETTRIQTQRESPLLMYIIPWEEAPLVESPAQRRIVVHDLFGDFYQPIDAGRYPAEESTPDY